MSMISYRRRNPSNLNQECLERFARLMNETCYSALFDFLRFCEKNRHLISPRVLRVILLVELPDLCFLAQLQNSVAVSEILLSIHHLQASALPNIVFFLAFHAVRERKLPKSRKRKGGSLALNFLTYFLGHSNATKLTFDGKRMTELMEAADPALYARFLLFADSRCVLRLLQYGLRFETSRTDSEVHPIFLYILRCLTEFSKGMVHGDLELRGNREPYPGNLSLLLTNFKYILRSTYNPHKVVLHMASSSESMSVKEQLATFFNSAIPLMDSNSKCQPVPTLKHLSRYVIRERLFENWLLPKGVGYLQIGSELANYIHLIK